MAFDTASRRRTARSVLLAMVTVTALVSVYYLLPLDHASGEEAAAILLVGLVGLVALVAFQVYSISRSAHPVLRAVEALAISVPLFLLEFAAAYVALSGLSSKNFNEPLDHSTALYFTVTVFATVGFGDITAKTDTARLLVTAQMLTDLVVIGVGVRSILTAVRRAR